MIFSISAICLLIGFLIGFRLGGRHVANLIMKRMDEIDDLS